MQLSAMLEHNTQAWHVIHMKNRDKTEQGLSSLICRTVSHNQAIPTSTDPFKDKKNDLH